MREVSAVLEQAGGEAPQGALLAARSLLDSDPPGAVAALLGYLPFVPPNDSGAWRLLLAEILDRDDAAVWRVVLNWLAAAPDPQPAWLLEEFAHHGVLRPNTVSRRLAPTDPEGRSALGTALLNSHEVSDAREGFRVADSQLRGTGEPLRVGIRVLGRARREEYATCLTRYLSDPDPETRREAIVAIGRLVTESSTWAVPELLGCLERKDVTLRRGVLASLERIRDPECVRPLLVLGEDLGQDEQRGAETVLLQIGRRSVPAALSTFIDGTAGFGSRLLAARVLARLDRRHFEAAASSVVSAELRRGERLLAAQRGLSGGGEASSPAAAVLSRFYEDVRPRLLRFVLEIQGLSGTLANVASVVEGLRFRGPSACDEAEKAIRQQLGGSALRSLDPLIDDSRRDGAIGRSRRDPEEPDVDKILTEGLSSPFDVEAAASAQWIHDREGGEALPRLRDAFMRRRSRFLRDTVAALAARDAGGTSRPTPIEVVAVLLQAEIFAPFSLFEVQAIAALGSSERVRTRRLLYSEGDPADSCFLVVEGSAEIRGPGGPEVRGPGRTFGEEALFGAARREAQAVGSTGSFLQIPVQDVWNLAESNPDFDVALLRPPRDERGEG